MSKKLTIEYVKQYIEEKHPGTICNFTEYKNINTKLDLICKNRHKFQISFHCIQHNQWCAECAGNKKYTIEYIKEKIQELHPGAICHSVEYKNNNDKLDLTCENGHSLKIAYRNIQENMWCAECYGNKKLTIEYIKNYINENYPGAICNSIEYKNVDTKLDLICENNHEFKACFTSIQQKHWCPVCAGRQKHTIEYVKETIEKMHPGSICNFDTYKDSNTKLDLICENGHYYSANFHCIKRGNWCPQCSNYKSEKYIRSIFEKLTGKKFTKTRPQWLLNYKTNYRLELDGFNDVLKIAFECQGQQHYKRHDKFHKTEEHFKDQQYRDNLKKELCKANNVNLICVPAIGVKVNNIVYTKKQIKTYIETQLKLIKR